MCLNTKKGNDHGSMTKDDSGCFCEELKTWNKAGHSTFCVSPLMVLSDWYETHSQGR